MKIINRAVITALFVVGTDVAVYFLKERFQEWLELPHAHVLSVVLLGAGLVAAILLLGIIDRIFVAIWNQSVFLRKLLSRCTGRPFLEGSWVDVGVEPVSRQIVDCSFISVTRKGFEYQMEGTSWRFPEGEAMSWASERCELNARALTIWYQGHRPSREYGKAEYRFSGGRRWRPLEFEGHYEYEEKLFRVEGRLLDAPPRDSKEARELAYQLAEEVRLKRESDESPRHAQAWYQCFVRHSDKLKEELSLLRSVTAGLSGCKFTTILDVGPSDGSLTRELLQSVPGLIDGHASYLAIEPQRSEFGKLVSALPPGLQVTLMARTIESCLTELQPGNFSLVLLLNVLYFVPQLEICQNVAALLAPGGCLLALHTDIANDTFLNELISEANPAVHPTVVEQLDRLAKNSHLELVGKKRGKITLTFPSISDAKWDLIERGGTVVGDDTHQLISFLIDHDLRGMEADKRRKVVRLVREHLQGRASNQIILPVAAHLLRSNGQPRTAA